MQWESEGFVIQQKTWGEKYLLINLFTFDHGRHCGLINSSKSQNPWQPGNHVYAHWQARISDHLGKFKIETKQDNFCTLLNKPKKLFVLQSVCQLLTNCLPERHPYSSLYLQTLGFLKSLPDNCHLVKEYILWEKYLLQELGFALDLKLCALTGVREDLTHVSPKTGKAVCMQAAQPYLLKLLPLPKFLYKDDCDYTDTDLKNGLNLTGHFIQRYLNQKLPMVRMEMYQ